MQFSLKWEAGAMFDGIGKVKRHQELAAGRWYEGHTQTGVLQWWLLEAKARFVSLVFSHLKLNRGRSPAGGGCSKTGQMLPLQVLGPTGRAAGLSVAAACRRYQELPKVTRNTLRWGRMTRAGGKRLGFEQN